MAGFRVKFLGARRVDFFKLEFGVEVVDELERRFAGTVHASDPQLQVPLRSSRTDHATHSPVLYPTLAFSPGLLPDREGKIGCAVMAALAGPLRSALRLEIGERVFSDAVAVVEIPLPLANHRRVRILWTDTTLEGFVFTFKVDRKTWWQRLLARLGLKERQ